MSSGAAIPVIGHMVNYREGSVGTQGIGYDYILGSGGVYVQSRSDHLVARIQAAACEVRGLAPVDEKVELPHGRIPSHLFELGLRFLQATPGEERFFAIRWDGHGYRMEVPDQEGSAAALTYTPPGDAVAEFHSHGHSRAFFSSTDDRDEQGFRIYGVVGRTGDILPDLALRVGVYGYFAPVSYFQVFEGVQPYIRLVETKKKHGTRR